jgi:hypothetical protein
MSEHGQKQLLESLRSEVDQIASALEAARKQVDEHREQVDDPSPTVKADLVRIMQLGVVMHDVQACRERLEELGNGCRLYGSSGAAASAGLERQRQRIYTQARVADNLERDCWRTGLGCFENGAVKMVDQARQHAIETAAKATEAGRERPRWVERSEPAQEGPTGVPAAGQALTGRAPERAGPGVKTSAPALGSPVDPGPRTAAGRAAREAGARNGKNV